MGGATPDFDLAIVGSGIIGAMVGHFATRGERGIRVLTVDGGGVGATDLSAGLDVPTGRNPRQRAMAARSSLLYARLRAERPTWPIRPVDTYWLIGRANLDRLRESMAGPRLSEVGPEEGERVAALFPGLRRSAGRVLLRSGGGVRADPGRLAGHLLADRRDLPGCAVWSGVTVTDVRSRGDRYELVGGGGEVRALARRVVVATGPRAPWGPFGEYVRARGLRTKKVAALHLGSRPPAGAPVLIFEDDDAFLLPLHEDGHWLFSFTSPHWDGRPGDGPPGLSPADLEVAAGVLKRYVPALAETAGEGRAFYDGYTPDRMPLVERVAGRPGVVLALGGNGSGYRLAPAIAEHALRLLGHGTHGDDRR